MRLKYIVSLVKSFNKVRSRLFLGLHVDEGGKEFLFFLGVKFILLI